MTWGMLIAFIVGFIWGARSGYILGIIQPQEKRDKWVMPEPDPTEEELERVRGQLL